MTPQTESAINLYRKQLAKALEAAPQSVRTEAIEDADEFLADEVRAMDVGRLSSQDAAYQRFIERFGTPEQLAATYREQCGEIASVKISVATKLRSWRRVAASILFFMIVSGGVAYAVLREPPKLSPFTDVRFSQDRVMVTYEKSEYEWLGFDDLDVTDIVASAQKQFGDRWKKRVAEDLVEVLWGMGHHPGTTAKLRLLSTETKQERVVRKAAMTNENRTEVYRSQRRGEDRLAMKVLADPLSYFSNQLKSRWAYYARSANNVDQSTAELRKRMTANPGKVHLPLELQKIIAKGLDGHASVSDWELGGRCLPFLIEPIGDRFVAFDADRKKLVDSEYPFIQSIDGVDLNDWITLSSDLVAKGSPQLVRRRSARLLRHIDHWRSEKGLPVTPSISVTLAAEDGDRTITKELATAGRKPIYGDWPRTGSHLLKQNIGYLRIPRMDEKAVVEIITHMRKFRDTRGLVIDVRGNGGGSRHALRTIASYLMSPNDLPRIANVAKYRKHEDFPQNHLAARFMYRADSERWTEAEKQAIAGFAKTFQPEWEPPEDQFSQWHYMVLTRLSDQAIYHYDKPVIVLSDAGCFSATDIFLAGLKGIPNVTIMGTPSGGGSARSESFTMPGTNLRIRLASMASFQPDGTLYDGNGVSPDQSIAPDPTYFVGGRDRLVEASITRLTQ